MPYRPNRRLQRLTPRILISGASIDLVMRDFMGAKVFGDLRYRSSSVNNDFPAFCMQDSQYLDDIHTA